MQEIQWLAELGSTAALQVILGLLIFLAIKYYLPKLTEEHRKQLDQSRNDFKEIIADLRLSFEKAIDDIEESLKELEDDNTKSATEMREFIRLYISQVSGDDVKKNRVLSDRVFDHDDEPKRKRSDYDDES